MQDLAQPNNLFEVDVFVNKFLQAHEQGVATMHRIYFHNSDQLSIRALTAELADVLKTGCVAFINKNRPMDEIAPYLFYIANDYCKKKSVPVIKKKTEYLCPACVYLGNNNIISYSNEIFKCDECEYAIKHTSDPKKIFLLKTFSRHRKIGYHCQDCKRFVPHPLDNSLTISCPYFDCCFVGEWSLLKKMHHPVIQSNPEKLILDDKKNIKDLIVSGAHDQHSQLEAEQTLQNQVMVLRDIIESQRNSLPYSSSDFTAKHKGLVYQAFDELLMQYPDAMVDYLLNQSRSGGFQHKIFQKYISLLEASLPLSFKKNNKIHRVESLLDESLSLFDGISTFDSMVSDKMNIKNRTEEFYIGGRKAHITKPYYIGKLINIINKETKESIINHVLEYSFSVIKVKDIVPGTVVTVTHLRVPPHYQMGGMVYVNRIRKKIIDRASAVFKRENDAKTNV